MTETFHISQLIQSGFWVTSSESEFEIGLERMFRACYGGEDIEIIVDEPIPDAGEQGLRAWCLIRGAGSVVFYASDIEFIKQYVAMIGDLVKRWDDTCDRMEGLIKP